MVNCDHHAILTRCMISIDRMQKHGSGATHPPRAAALALELFLRSDPCSINRPATETYPQRNQYLPREHSRIRSQSNSQSCRGLLTSLTPRNLPRPLIRPTPRSPRCQNLLTSLTKACSRGSNIAGETTTSTTGEPRSLKNSRKL